MWSVCDQFYLNIVCTNPGRGLCRVLYFLFLRPSMRLRIKTQRDFSIKRQNQKQHYIDLISISSQRCKNFYKILKIIDFLSDLSKRKPNKPKFRQTNNTSEVIGLRTEQFEFLKRITYQQLYKTQEEPFYPPEKLTLRQSPRVETVV